MVLGQWIQWFYHQFVDGQTKSLDFCGLGFPYLNPKQCVIYIKLAFTTDPSVPCAVANTETIFKCPDQFQERLGLKWTQFSCFVIVRFFGIFPRLMGYVHLPGDYSVSTFDKRIPYF